MCIICNMTTHKGSSDASDFVDQFSEASAKMKRATATMLAVSQQTAPEYRKQYDRAHKKMVRLLREWNSIEHEREVAAKPAE